MLDRHEDMAITGGRNPFLCHYTVGFDEDGTIQVLDITVYNNAGSSRDLSAAVKSHFPTDPPEPMGSVYFYEPLFICLP